MTTKRDVPASPPATGKERRESPSPDPGGATPERGGRRSAHTLHRVPAYPRDCFCGECAAVDRPCASCVAKGLGEFAAPVASGTPKPMNVVLGVLREMANGSPAPAAPGVELDFDAAMREARANKGQGFGVDSFYRAALNAQHRALIDAAVSKAREPLLAEIAAIAKAADEDDHALLGLSIVWIGGDDGDVLHNEYLTWYKPSEWPLGEHRAVSAFLAGKFRAYTCLRALVEEWQEAKLAVATHEQVVETAKQSEEWNIEHDILSETLYAAEAALAAWTR